MLKGVDALSARLSNHIIYTGAVFLRRFGVDFHEENDPNVIEMRETIKSLENKSIEFKAEIHPDGSWSAESVNVEGIITGGDDPRDIQSMLKDAIYTYFEIPPQLCRDELLRSDNEPATVQQKVHVGA